MRKCVGCGTLPFDIAVPSVIHDCLREYRASSFAAIQPYLQHITIFATRDWFDALPNPVESSCTD